MKVENVIEVIMKMSDNIIYSKIKFKAGGIVK